MLKQLKRDNPALNLDLLRKEVGALNKWYEKEEINRGIRKEWIVIAQPLDLFFFWLLLFLYSAGCVILLVMLPHLLVDTQIDKH